MEEDEKTIDYSTMTYDQLMAEVGKAWEAKDMKLMGTLSRLATKAEAEVEKEKKTALLAELVAITQQATVEIRKAINKLVDAGKIPAGAEGVWFAWDFAAIEEKGINPACRLVRTGKKASSGTGNGGKSSYVANPTKSADLLAQVGDEILFAEDTERTIDKQTVVLPAGTTYRQAYDYSTNGGWRNSIRMALLKKAGII